MVWRVAERRTLCVRLVVKCYMARAVAAVVATASPVIEAAWTRRLIFRFHFSSVVVRVTRSAEKRRRLKESMRRAKRFSIGALSVHPAARKAQHVPAAGIGDDNRTRSVPTPLNFKHGETRISRAIARGQADRELLPQMRHRPGGSAARCAGKWLFYKRLGEAGRLALVVRSPSQPEFGVNERTTSNLCKS